MFYAFILAFTIGLVIMFGNRTASAKWAASMMFSGAFGFLGWALSDEVISSFVSTGIVSAFMEPYLVIFAKTGIGVSVYVLPCCYLNYAYSYWEFRKATWMTKAGIWLHWPVALMLVLYHEHPLPYTEFGNQLNFIWAAFMIIGASAVIITSYVRDPNPVKRSNRKDAILIFVPLMLVDLVTGYSGIMFGYLNMFFLNTVLITVIFLWFIVVLIKRGLFGLRLRLEKQRYLSAISGFGSGVAQLNHTMKNQATLLVLFGERLKQIAENPTKEQIVRQAKLIADTGHHLTEWADRIHAQTQEILLCEESVNLVPLIEANLTTLEQMSGAIRIIRDYTIVPILRCDPTHVKETIGNIIVNASEAMNNQGVLTARIYVTGKWLIISFEDIGHGLNASELVKVLQPFYTTKRDSRNYGLGLSYCLQVMERHQGDLRLYSKEGHGTTVSLCFPLKRMIGEAG